MALLQCGLDVVTEAFLGPPGGRDPSSSSPYRRRRGKSVRRHSDDVADPTQLSLCQSNFNRINIASAADLIVGDFVPPPYALNTLKTLSVKMIPVP